jgi:hypothetical protein
MVTAKFRVYNPSRTAARIEFVEVNFLFPEMISIQRMLTPQEGHWIEIPVRLISAPAAEITVIKGRVTYTDIFRKTRHRKFAKTCIYTNMQISFVDPQMDEGLNDEEEWNKD